MDHYTHIVVGAGSAGCVIAARLVSNLDNRVLLIEAGADYKTEADIPIDISDASVPSQQAHDWGMLANGTGERPISMIRGKVMGGSSAVNACIALRAEPTDFEEWNKEWTWASVLPYYKKLESDVDFPDKSYHGQSGPLPVRRWSNEELHPLSVAFLLACEIAGYKIIADHNKPDSTGCGSLPMNAINGRRISTADAYLRPIRNQKNITILADALADQVLFEGTRAIGISVVTKVGIKNIFGDEVVLSSGTFGTPAILLRSGVGPSKDLKELRINTVLDLPGVGANLSDHSQVPLGVEVKNPHALDNLPPCIQALLRYSSGSSGPVNDMQICLLNQVDVSIFTPYLSNLGNREKFFFLTSNLMLPTSRGKVTLKSKKPADNPNIDIDFCQSSEDVRRHREGLRKVCKLVESDSFSDLRGQIFEADALFGSDEKLDAFIYERIQTAHHPCGTAKMGTENDPMAVVDSNCAVIGAKNLYIADASVIPVPIRANTNLTCIMIGERLAANLLAMELK